MRKVFAAVGFLLALLVRSGTMPAHSFAPKLIVLIWGFLATFPASLVVNLLWGASYYSQVVPHLVAGVLTVAWFLHRDRRQQLAPPVELEPPQTPRFSRREFLAGASLSGVALCTGAYGYSVGRYALEVTHTTIPMAGLPSELDGLKVVLMADWHCSQFNSQDYLRRAVRMANAENPDLILLPGDFVSYTAERFPHAAELAAELRCKIPGGILASLGNHDHWHGPDLCRQLLTQAGVRMMENRALRLTPGRDFADDWQGAGLCLAGVDDLWTSKILLRETLAAVPSQFPRLVLAHNPDTAERFPNALVDLMVSGHTHGGQVCFPVLGAPFVPSEFGDKYIRGLIQGPAYPVYVTRGVGVGGVPLRVGVPPEISVLHLVATKGRTPS